MGCRNKKIARTKFLAAMTLRLISCADFTRIGMVSASYVSNSIAEIFCGSRHSPITRFVMISAPKGSFPCFTLRGVSRRSGWALI